MRRSLVLSGGGLAGIAWQLGVLRGIEEVDPVLSSSIRQADTMVGTSAGAAVAVQITSGEELDALFSAQLRDGSSELEVKLDPEHLMGRLVTAAAGATGPEDLRRRIGALAIDTPTVSEPTRRAAIAARLPQNILGRRRPSDSPRSTP